MQILRTILQQLQSKGGENKSRGRTPPAPSKRNPALCVCEVCVCMYVCVLLPSVNDWLCVFLFVGISGASLA